MNIFFGIINGALDWAEALIGPYLLPIGFAIKWIGFALSPLLLLPLLLLLVPGIFTPIAKRLITVIERISALALYLAIWLAGLMVLVQILVIIGRYVFDWSASWANEIIIYSFASLFLLAAASALRHGAHVRVDILREKMSPKARASVDLAGIYLFLIPICALILWSAISPSFVRSWLNFEGSRESDGLRIYYIFRTLVPMFAALLMTQGFAEALKASLTLRSPDSDAKPAPQAIPSEETD